MPCIVTKYTVSKQVMPEMLLLGAHFLIQSSKDNLRYMVTARLGLITFPG